MSKYQNPSVYENDGNSEPGDDIPETTPAEPVSTVVVYDEDSGIFQSVDLNDPSVTLTQSLVYDKSKNTLTWYQGGEAHTLDVSALLGAGTVVSDPVTGKETSKPSLTSTVVGSRDCLVGLGKLRTLTITNSDGSTSTVVVNDLSDYLADKSTK